MTLTKSSHPTLSNFFFQSELEDFRIFRRFEQLSSSIGWRVILVQSGAKTGS